jgi:hypothetical protein
MTIYGPPDKIHLFLLSALPRLLLRFLILLLCVRLIVICRNVTASCGAPHPAQVLCAASAYWTSRLAFAVDHAGVSAVGDTRGADGMWRITLADDDEWACVEALVDAVYTGHVDTPPTMSWFPLLMLADAWQMPAVLEAISLTLRDKFHGPVCLLWRLRIMAHLPGNAAWRQQLLDDMTAWAAPILPALVVHCWHATAETMLSAAFLADLLPAVRSRHPEVCVLLVHAWCVTRRRLGGCTCAFGPLPYPMVAPCASCGRWRPDCAALWDILDLTRYLSTPV